MQQHMIIELLMFDCIEDVPVTLKIRIYMRIGVLNPMAMVNGNVKWAEEKILCPLFYQPTPIVFLLISRISLYSLTRL
jgi:hypothetical protein